jgi:hypothetical protein
MIRSNLERNAQTITGWTKRSEEPELLSGAGSVNSPYSKFFPFDWYVCDWLGWDSTTKQLEFDIIESFLEALRVIGFPDVPASEDWRTWPSSFLLNESLTKFSRWFWMISQDERLIKTVALDKKLWADPLVKESAVVLQNRYVNVNALVYGNDRCYVNSILVNPYLDAKGLGSIAYRRLENFVVQKFQVKRMFLTPLRPMDYNTPGVKNDLTTYWRDKMGFHWPDGAELQNLNPRPAKIKGNFGRWENDRTNEPVERYFVNDLSEVEPNQPYFIEKLPAGRQRYWQSHSMWKKAEIYPPSMTTSTNEGFNDECEFNKNTAMEFMIVDLLHETKMKYVSYAERQDLDDKLTESIWLLDPNPVSNSPLPPPSPVSSVDDLFRYDLKSQASVPNPGINPIPIPSGPRRSARLKKRNKGPDPNIVLARPSSVNQTTVKQTPIINSQPKQSSQAGKYVGTFPPMITDDSDTDVTTP